MEVLLGVFAIMIFIGVAILCNKRIAKNEILENLKQTVINAKEQLVSKYNVLLTALKDKKTEILTADSNLILDVKPRLIIDYRPTIEYTDDIETYNTKVKIFKIIEDRFYEQKSFDSFNAFVDSIVTECLLKKITFCKYVTKDIATTTDGYSIYTSPASSVSYGYVNGHMSTFTNVSTGSRVDIPDVTQHSEYSQKVYETVDDLKEHIRDYYIELLYALIFYIDNSIINVNKSDNIIRYYNALIKLNNYTDLYLWQEACFDVALYNIYNIDEDDLCQYIQNVTKWIDEYGDCVDEHSTFDKINNAIKNINKKMIFSMDYLKNIEKSIIS